MRSRMSGSMSRATKRRMRSHHHTTHEIKRLLAGPATDALAVSGKTALHNLVPLSIRNRDIDQADGLFFGAAGRPGDACDSQSDVGIADLTNVFCQRQGNFLADRTVSL